MRKPRFFPLSAHFLYGLLTSQCTGNWIAEPETKILDNFTSSNHQTIVGGSPVSVDEYPWFVQANGCGGALVAPDVVVTAAHCLNFFPPGGQVRIGNRQRDSGQKETVESSLVHSMYGKPAFHHDLMIVKLQGSVDKTPIKLNRVRRYPETDTKLTAMGFGQIAWENVTSPILMDVVLHEYRDCGSIYGRNLDERFILCAGSHEAKGTCLGDSGGPLVAANGNLVGVTSFGPGGCGMPDVPSGFTRISNHFKWLQRNICGISRQPPAYLCGKKRRSYLRD